MSGQAESGAPGKRDRMETGEKEARKRYETWLQSPVFDQDTKRELEMLKGDAAEITDRFYRELEFGTGGLRGLLGAGSNRMNRYTVRKATQGLANYIRKEHREAKGVAIAYDSRRLSPELAEEAALCLAANGIRAYVFESLRPTPELSFALRELGCTAGIVVTASHNPPEYNGYKVYWEDGAQITFPRDSEIIREVSEITDYGQARTMSLEEAREQGLYQVIGREIDDRYIEEIRKLSIHPEIIREQGKDLKIVYTPLHGTGNLPVRRILKELGFQKVWVVPEQEKPDGGFPTVSYPNPEDKKAFVLALQLAGEVDADLVLATDPDADRLGIYGKNTQTGEYEPFTGNMSGMIILEYLLSQKKRLGRLPADGAVVTTIVSGKMSREITRAYGADLIETLTGFKYIGEQIRLFEENGEHEFLFGYEESYGCLTGTHARDKDAVSAVAMLCEAAAYYRHEGITLCQQMDRLYEKYGYYREDLCTVAMKGIEGAAKIRELMEAIRKDPPERIGPWRVQSFRDYETGKVMDRAAGEIRDTGLLRSNVLYFELEDMGWCCVRPSGTEPKVKFYMGVRGESREDAQEKLECLTREVRRIAGE